MVRYGRVLRGRVVETAGVIGRHGFWLPIVGAPEIGVGEERAYRVDGDVIRAEARPIPLERLASQAEAAIEGEEMPTERMARIALEAVDAVRAVSKKLPPEAESVLTELRDKHGKRKDKIAKIADAKAKGDRAALLAILAGD